MNSEELLNECGDEYLTQQEIVDINTTKCLMNLK